MDPHPPDGRPPRPVAADRRASYYADVRQRVGCMPNADPSAAELTVHLLYTHDVIETRMARYFGAHSLSLSAFNVLMILRNSPQREMALHQLSELLLVSRANVTGLVDCLEQRGLVERRVDPKDRRVRIARLTDEAEALLVDLLPGHYALIASMCSGLSEKERKTLRGLLEKLRASAEEVS